MAMNFLQPIRNAPMRAPSMPMTNQAPAPSQMPQMGGNLQAMTQGAPDTSRLANIMQLIGGDANAAPAQMQQQPAGEAPRKKRSFLDIIGGLADAVATVGGSEAMYQPTLDAREDRTRSIDMDEMRKQILEQQITQGGQTLEAGEVELADTERSRLGTALGAIATNPEAIGMWPQIAKEAGITDERAAQIGGLLEQNPEMAGALAQSLGWTPAKTAQGSQAKELQVYGLLQQESPELARAYLQKLTNPDSMSEYQQAQLGIAMARLGLEEDKFDASEERADEKAAGGADLTPKQRGDITMKLKLLPNVRAQYNRVRTLYNEMIQEGTLARGGLGGLVPGQLAGGKAEQFDKAAGALRKSILSLTRIPGVGAMSNYETVLDEQALPTRWGSDEGRQEAINGIGSVLDSYEAGYKDMLGSAPAARPAAPARRPAARDSGAPAPRRSVSPAAAEARRRGLIQ